MELPVGGVALLGGAEVVAAVIVVGEPQLGVFREGELSPHPHGVSGCGDTEIGVDQLCLDVVGEERKEVVEGKCVVALRYEISVGGESVAALPEVLLLLVAGISVLTPAEEGDGETEESEAEVEPVAPL